jgi:hypothetical protein
MTPLSIALTAFRHRITSLPKFTLQTSAVSDSYSEILKDINVLIEVKTSLRLGNTLVPMILMSDGTHLPNFGSIKI